MKKIALLLVAAALAAAPAAAGAKHKKAAKKPDDTFAKQSANTARILRDGLPLVLPSWAVPIYFGMHMDKTGTTKPVKKHHHRKVAKKTKM
jgi:hypothetical protein